MIILSSMTLNMYNESVKRSFRRVGIMKNSTCKKEAMKILQAVIGNY